MPILKLPDLYRALSKAGLRKAQVRVLLPDWWDDEAAKTEVGLWEFVILLARRLSVDANLLSQGTIQPIGAVERTAFKHRRTLESEAYGPSSMIAASLAESIVAATRRPFTRPASDIAVIREEIRQANNGIVDFDGLLFYCWKHGIPVIPLPNLPIGIRKMDGAVFMIHERPAIVISRKNDSRSWLSFILAHELGHYCKGHMQESSSIIDVDLKSDLTTQVEYATDPQELEADQFALDLLGGASAQRIIEDWSPRMSGVELAVKGREISRLAGVSAGHLVLRHAYRTKRWVAAQQALNFLDEDFEAQAYLIETLKNEIELDNIAEDLQDLVVSITGVPYA